MLSWLRSLFRRPSGPSGPRRPVAAPLVRKRIVSRRFPHITAEIDGEDLVIWNASATAFGGPDDDLDSGETASGISTIANPGLPGCALPMDFGPCAGSPIPRLPWRTPVDVTDVLTGKTITALLIDLGPAAWTGDTIDLTVAAARQFNPLASATNFSARVHIRIPGAAQYLNNSLRGGVK